MKDARHGQPRRLSAAITNPSYRQELILQNWKDVGKVFVIAAVWDSIYQLIAYRGVYVLELLIVATVLAVVPYILVRGPVSLIAKSFT